MPRSLLLFIYSSSRFRSGTRPCRCSCSAVPRDLLFIRGAAGGGHACLRGSMPLFLFRCSAGFFLFIHGATGSGHACLGGSMPLFLFRRSAGFIIYSRAAGGSGTNMSKSIYSLVPVPTFIDHPFIFKSGTGTR